ncbi:MAG TPA: GNAT family N-acetyltransferase [Bacteroidales bacterium]|nr:GNAT family N-acetyltransferase [Bacteroidales bacterium]
MNTIQYKASFNLTIEFVKENLEKYTFPNIRKQIQSIDIKNPILAVSVRKNNNIVGLCIAEYDFSHSYSEIISFYLDPEMRNKGIGQELLNKTEQILSQKGYEEVRTYFWSSWSSAEATKHILSKQGWSEPERLMDVFRTDIARIARIPWREKITLPEGYEIIPWSWVSPDEKKEIRDEQEFMPFYPEAFSPFYHEDQLAYYTSLALKFKGRVIGWILSYWNSPTTIEYNNVFIRKEYRTGIKIPLEMIRIASVKQIRQNIPDIIWSAGEENTLLERFLERKFGEYSEKATIYRSVKEL